MAEWKCERNVKCQIKIISEYPSQQLNNANSIMFNVQRDVPIPPVPEVIEVSNTIYSLRDAFL